MDEHQSIQMTNATNYEQVTLPPLVQSDGEKSTPLKELDKLCISCYKLKLTISDFECTLTTHRTLLERTLADLKSARDCALCSLVAYAVEDTRAQWDLSQSYADESVICKAILQQYPYPTSRPFNIINIVTNYAFHGPSYGMQLYPVGASTHSNIILGRKIDGGAGPLTLIQSWLQECEGSHKNTCGLARGGDFSQVVDKLLLIDVHQNCIVPALERSRYIALSYVWGHVEQIQLTTKNQNMLMVPGGLLSVANQIPQVIRDAMELANKIGERFLWVDSLCIPQDDDTIKLPLINQMNLIYRYAFLTIFAASSESANDGLPRIHSRYRQPSQATATVSPDFSFCYPLSHANLALSKWATRGWTFQEYYFSRRRLIFLNGIVYFRCCTSTWREDLALETINIKVDQLDLSIGFKARSEHWELPEVIEDIFQLHGTYTACVQAYVSRQLSHDGDALRAFGGISNFIESTFGLDFYQGHIKHLLFHDLFWQPETFMQRRQAFPSWSWAGWKGRMWMPSLAKDISLLSSFIAWYSWDPTTSQYSIVPGTKFDIVDVQSLRFRLRTCNITLIGALQALAQSWHTISQTRESDSPPYQEYLSWVCSISQLAYPNLNALPEFRTQLKTQGSVRPGTLLFRAPVATMWLSARAPNGELTRDIEPERYVDIVERPALYLYSVVEPELMMLGIAWINDSTAFSQVKQQTLTASADINSADIKVDRICQPLVVTSRGIDGPANSEATRAKLSEMLNSYGVVPDDTTFALPKEPAIREKFCSSRRIEKIKVAILSGPTEGNARSRRGVPMSFPYTTSRRFFRALLLRKIEGISDENGQPCYHYERLGTGELELSAVNNLDDLAFEDIVLG